MRSRRADTGAPAPPTAPSRSPEARLRRATTGALLCLSLAAACPCGPGTAEARAPGGNALLAGGLAPALVLSGSTLRIGWLLSQARSTAMGEMAEPETAIPIEAPGRIAG